MSPIFLFFLSSLILFSIPVAYSQSYNMHAFLLGEGEKSFTDDKIILENNETLDLTTNVIPVPPTSQIVGGVQVDLSLEVVFIADDKPVVTLLNTALLTVVVEIPDQTRITAPSTWNKELQPPKQIKTTGDIPSGFKTPGSVIQVGSPDVILIFDKTVTIILKGVTGQTAYKLPGEDTWNLIDGCLGTYANPTDPDFPNECSISSIMDTKIVTYHFTEFVALEEETPKKISEGFHRTGVGPSSGGGSIRGQVLVSDLPEGEEIKEEEIKEEEIKKVKIPDWFRVVFSWWAEGKVTTEEVNTAWEYLLKVL